MALLLSGLYTRRSYALAGLNFGGQVRSNGTYGEQLSLRDLRKIGHLKPRRIGLILPYASSAALQNPIGVD